MKLTTPLTFRRMLATLAVASLAACHAGTPGTPFGLKMVLDKWGIPVDGATYRGGSPYRTLGVTELPIVGVTAESSLVASRHFSAEAIVDGDLSTQWANATYQAATSWCTLALADVETIFEVAIKTGPCAPGTSYDIQVSADGSTFTTVLANQVNTTWNLEVKALPAGTTAKFVRILCHNDSTNPCPRFTIFEVQLNASAAVGLTAELSLPAPPTGPAPSIPPGAVPCLPILASALHTYGGLDAGLAIDGLLSTLWASGTVHAPEAWLSVDLGAQTELSHCLIKTGALPTGVSFVIEGSVDCTTWTPCAGPTTNTTWSLEAKLLTGTCRYLRIRFLNREVCPLARFFVFELQVFAKPGVAGVVSSVVGASPSPLPSPSLDPEPIVSPVASALPSVLAVPSALPSSLPTLVPDLPPVIGGCQQLPLPIVIGASGSLNVAVSDPEGGPCTLAWSALRGTIVGNGALVTYLPGLLDLTANTTDVVTVTAVDGAGNATSKVFTIELSAAAALSVGSVPVLGAGGALGIGL